MLFNIAFLEKIFPQNRGTFESSLPINEVSTDSRTTMNHALFIPIIGDNFDGHDYITQAYENGACATLWCETIPVPETIPDTFPVFLVKDTIVALQTLAKAYRDRVNPTVIGVTGSNGKTTTKDILQALLQKQYKTYSTVGNFNNHIGLPLTILQMDSDTDMLILEMGMDHFGEIEILSQLSRPDYAIITNIGESHIEHLGSRAGIAQAKLEITCGLKETGTLIIDGDEPLLTSINKKYLSCGFSEENDYVITDVMVTNKATTFQFNNATVFQTPLVGKHHAKNCGLAMVVAKHCGITDEEILQGLLEINHTTMRFEWLKGKNNVDIINDAYNASPTSMKGAIAILKELTGFETKVLVLGDILELGDYSDEFHQSIASDIAAPINYVYTFGKYSEVITEEVQRKKQAVQAEHFTDKTKLLKTINQHIKENTVVLFKASRGMALETVIEQLL